MYRPLIKFFTISLIILNVLFKSKSDLLLENIALRQQLSTYLIKKTKPKLSDLDRSFWIALKHIFGKWRNSLVIVKPQTVIDWQNRRFKRHWTQISAKNKSPGRKRIKKEVRDLIYGMAGDNMWGAPRIYSEILMLGFTDVSEATVSRYLRKFRSQNPNEKRQQSWMTFLRNHRDVIFAMDFFIVPTVTLNILFVFFIIDHKRRIIEHLNVTAHPYAQWVIQQLRDAFPFDSAPKYLIMDRDKIFSPRVKAFLESQLGVQPKVTSSRAPGRTG